MVTHCGRPGLDACHEVETWPSLLFAAGWSGAHDEASIWPLSAPGALVLASAALVAEPVADQPTTRTAQTTAVMAALGIDLWNTERTRHFPFRFHPEEDSEHGKAGTIARWTSDCGTKRHGFQ